jgi:membrane protein implicated in regulation of membrane protease activity
VQLHPTNADKLLGITSKVTRTQGNGQGIIRIEGEEWSCDAEVDLKAGDKVRVIEVKGSLLAVEIIK